MYNVILEFLRFFLMELRLHVITYIIDISIKNSYLRVNVVGQNSEIPQKGCIHRKKKKINIIYSSILFLSGSQSGCSSSTYSKGELLLRLWHVVKC